MRQTDRQTDGVQDYHSNTSLLDNNNVPVTLSLKIYYWT